MEGFRPKAGLHIIEMWIKNVVCMHKFAVYKAVPGRGRGTTDYNIKCNTLKKVDFILTKV